MSSDYLDLSDLAREVSRPIPEVHRKALDIMDDVYRTGGVNALSGYSTGTRQKGAVAVATISARLAQAVRDFYLAQRARDYVNG